MGMLFLVGLMAANQSRDETNMSFNQMHSDQAFYIAEAGARHAFVEINDDNLWRTGFSQRQFDRGAYDVILVDSAAQPSLDDTVLIRSTGILQEAETTVDFWTVPEYKYPFQWAMFAESGISLDKNTCTDSFNSDSGSYADTRLDSAGTLGTNGTVTGAKDINIGGDVLSATPGGISFGPNTTITGDTNSTMDSVSLDHVQSSEYDWAKTVSVAQTGITGTNFNYNHGSKTLTVGSSGIITLASGVYYFSSIEAQQDSKILLAPGADVRIYVGGDIVFRQNSTFNELGNPANAIVYSQGTTLQFDQGNIFKGAYYGPNAHIQYDQTTQVFGALVGNTIQLDQGACFHYDRNLAKIKKGTTGAMLMVAWNSN
jgi:hypothetical protein